MPSIEEAAELPALKPLSSKSTLVAEPESFTPEASPEILPAESLYPSRHSLPNKQYHTSSSRRLSGRLAPNVNGANLHSFPSLSSIRSSSTLDAPGDEDPQIHGKFPHRVRHYDHARQIILQVAQWLRSEKARKAAHKGKRDPEPAKHVHVAEAAKQLVEHVRHDHSKPQKGPHNRTKSDLSDGSLALEKLEAILSQSMDPDGDGLLTPKEDKQDSYFPRRKSKRQSSRRLLRRASTIGSSDTEYQEPDIDVPSAEVILDNSKTLGYSGGAAISEVNVINPKRRATKDKEAWLLFKHEILRLAHTLRLKGWRRIPIDCSPEIDVERLSGALTNAVYVVSPPSHIPQTPSGTQDSAISLIPKKPPPKLLMRIYGPQVEHLIDRENELAILRRLARKRIGPRLLGTFTNGRFEQFFHARTLTAKDIRIPDTSRHIAKRMRELHDGIELLESERNEGAFVWRNWDKWKNRCEEVISYLDNQILKGKQGSATSSTEAWKKRGLVCGVEWSIFRHAVRQYRDWLYEQYGGEAAIRQQLIFAHNDTQYGNLLRLEPTGESPLLLPANEHKQLIVIDFEYASANVPGLEFANHFTEWCYNYHASPPYALNNRNYPTPEEQHRFFKAYLQHRPPIQSHQSLSPSASSPPVSRSSISSFMLDSRAPPAQIVEDEKQRDAALENDIRRLSHETRLWRLANSAMWVAWGIVQAKVPGMDEALEAQKNGTPRSEETINCTLPTHLSSDPLSSEADKSAQAAQNKRPEEASPEDNSDEEEEFDYLGYAQERAMFFWGDVLQLGIMKREDLPESLLEKVKVVEY